MKLRIEGTLGNPRVFNADTGEELLGVKEVKIEAGHNHPTFNRVTLQLDAAVIDLAVDAERVEVSMNEDGKYAHAKLKDVARLVWRR